MKELFRQFLKETGLTGETLHENYASLSIKFNKWLYQPNRAGRMANSATVYPAIRKHIIQKWAYEFDEVETSQL
jgi:hypothetical protein